PIETNAQAAIDVLRTRGIETVSGFVFEMPGGVKVTIIAEDDPFLDRPYEAGTKITIFTSAQAGAFIKVAGDCWYLHQNDPDPWPSDFHAHHAERKEVLDCYSGKIYDSRTRKLIRKYGHKQLAGFLGAVPTRLKR